MNKPKELQTTTQIIAREGFKPVGVCVALMLLFIFLHFEFLAIFALICAIFCAFIFRNTERIAQYRGSDAIIAPCDGIIKDISLSGSTTAILFKINIFDSGIFRVPAYITRTKSAFRFGLFIKSDKNLQSILNTKHKVSGFLGDLQVFTITLLPEAWNKANIYALDNLSLGMRFRTCENFGDFADFKSSLNPQNFHKYKSHTANTSIVIRNANQGAKNPSLRGESQDSPKQSKTRKSNKNSESMIDKRINKLDSTLQQGDSSNLTPCDLDSSLVALAQNDNMRAHSTIFIGDRLGFMKYGYLLLEIHAPCKLLAQRGDNLFAGESLIGKFQANLY
ncbi:hypothetical protein ACWIUD_00535 [Helicobacter sp. 23-1044]